jgi:transglutaminase-like putative cysteine protease
VRVPAAMRFDYRSFNIPDENSQVLDSGGERIYTWTLENLLPVKRELMGPPWFELFPALIMRPDEFSMERLPGSMQNWESFASWFTYLWRDRDALPEHVRQEVDRLRDVAADDRQLVDMIYRYVQGNTRYVSIQLGIGGLQTETAIITARNRYGDCKALSNYLLGMLRYAGFEAYPALIRNGAFSFPFDTNFVHDPFNHVVVMVPLNGEQIWLESTSSTFPPGYIGSSNSNRYALLFGKPQGELVRTPRLTYRDNYQIRHATVTMKSDGSAELLSETQYGGSQHERLRYLQGVRGTNRERAMRNMVPYSSFDIVSETIRSDSLMPTSVLEKKLEVSSFATRLGSRLMFHPNLFERGSSFLPAMDDRSQPVFTGSAYHDLDEITIMIPESHDVEAIPEGLTLEFKFGEFSVSVSVSDDGRSLVYRRELIMRPGVLPAEEYQLFREFVNERIRHDNSQVVLVARADS